MLLFIDNYDSFTYNIVQYFAELGQEVLVRCNDEITIEEIEALKPQYLVIGPGPCSPKEAGISVAAMQHFAGRLPSWACASAIKPWAKRSAAMSCARKQ